MIKPINGNGWKTWALGIAVALAGALFSWGWGANSSRIDGIVAMQQIRGERLAKAESEIAALKFQLERMENKLDRLLEAKRNPL